MRYPSDSGAIVDVTRYVYIETMKGPAEQTVKVAELKARLSAYLRAVRRGHPVTVCDRDTPIARLVPYAPEGEPLMVRRPIRKLHEIPLPPRLGRPVDSLRALLDERQASR